MPEGDRAITSGTDDCLILLASQSKMAGVPVNPKSRVLGVGRAWGPNWSKPASILPEGQGTRHLAMGLKQLVLQIARNAIVSVRS